MSDPFYRLPTRLMPENDDRLTFLGSRSSTMQSAAIASRHRIPPSHPAIARLVISAFSDLFCIVVDCYPNVKYTTLRDGWCNTRRGFYYEY
jgi:hypothetical protein